MGDPPQDMLALPDTVAGRGQPSSEMDGDMEISTSQSAAPKFLPQPPEAPCSSHIHSRIEVLWFSALS